MSTFTCIFPTIFKGERRPKGFTISIPDAEIRLPGNEPLSNPRSFVRVDSPVPAAAPAADPDAPATRDSLAARLQALGITIPAKATIAQMQKILAEATDPAGNPVQ
jgi:hypothetical protein